jgi:hypothetical protein
LPSTSGGGLLASPALPDSDGSSLGSVLVNVNVRSKEERAARASKESERKKSEASVLDTSDRY